MKSKISGKPSNDLPESRLMDLINRDEIIQDFCTLVQIDSPSFEEEKIIQHCLSVLKKLQFKTEKTPFTYHGNNSANIYGYKKGKLKGNMILGAHMDVVKPCLSVKPQVKDDIITSDGTTVLGGDNKIALTAILYALKVLSREKIEHIDIELAITSAEEVGVVGARFFETEKFHGNKGVILDAGGRYGGIVVGAPTHDTYKLVIHGLSSHAGIAPEKGDNAIVKTAKVLPLLPSGRIDNETVANIGTITGGKATNIVPDEVTINGEIRSFKTEKVEEIINSINNALKNALEEKDYTLRWIREYTSYSFDENDPFIHKISEIIKKTGIQPHCFVTGGGSDANAFNTRELQIVNLSCGMMNPHSLDEHIYIDDLIKSTLFLLEILTTPEE